MKPFLQRLKKPEVMTGVALTATVIFFHLTFFNHVGGFWRDEVNLINISTGSLEEITHDSCPILMPLLTRLCAASHVMAPDRQLRLFGVAIGLALLAIFWRNGQLSGNGPPIFSLALGALNSTLIIYGDSLRAYGLGCVTIALMVSAAISFIRKPSAFSTVWLAISATASVQALYHNAVLVAAICFGLSLVCGLARNWKGLLQVFLAGLAAAVSLLPYLRTLRAGRQNCTPLYTGFTWTNYFGSINQAMDAMKYVWGILTCWLIWRGYQAMKSTVGSEPPLAAKFRVFAGGTWLATIAGFTVFLIASQLPTEPWYLLSALTVGVGCFDLGLDVDAPRWQKLKIGGAWLVGAAAVVFSQTDLSSRFTNMDDWGGQLAKSCEPEDYIVLTPWYCGISFDYYYHGKAKWDTIPPLANHKVHAYDQVKDSITRTNVMEPILGQMEKVLKSGHRVYILRQSGGGFDPTFPGEQVANLPPAPYSTNGWRHLPYVANWTEQLDYYVRQHSRAYATIHDDVNAAPVKMRTEKLQLSSAAGWR